jgi:hypothetical protein
LCRIDYCTYIRPLTFANQAFGIYARLSGLMPELAAVQLSIKQRDSPE